jgi:hypothetical protein
MQPGQIKIISKDDLQQERHLADLEGKNRIWAARRARCRFKAIGQIRNPDGKKEPAKEWSTLDEDRKREKIMAAILGYDVPAWMRYWNKTHQKQRNLLVFRCPATNVKILKNIDDYKWRMWHRANPPVYIGGNKKYWIDEDTGQKFFISRKKDGAERLYYKDSATCEAITGSDIAGASSRSRLDKPFADMDFNYDTYQGYAPGDI